MPSRTTVAAAPLLAILALAPELAWAGAHALQHHARLEPGEHGHCHVAIELAQDLVHGHRHPEGTPDHDHHLLPPAPARPELVRHLEAPGSAAPEARAVPARLQAEAGAEFSPRPARVVRAGPRLLHSLGVLLI